MFSYPIPMKHVHVHKVICHKIRSIEDPSLNLSTQSKYRTHGLWAVCVRMHYLSPSPIRIFKESESYYIRTSLSADFTANAYYAQREVSEWQFHFELRPWWTLIWSTGSRDWMMHNHYNTECEFMSAIHRDLWLLYFIFWQNKHSFQSYMGSEKNGCDHRFYGFKAKLE